MAKGTISGSVITCGGQDNSSGVFKVANASGTTIGTWDKDGINVLSGSIKGTTIVGSTITVGGASTERGLLRIVDDGGELIGSWNYEGIHVMKGSIRGTTITGNTISGNTISGGTVSGATVSGGTVSGTTIKGTKIYLESGNSSGIKLVASGTEYGTIDHDGIVFDSAPIDFTYKKVVINIDNGIKLTELPVIVENATELGDVSTKIEVRYNRINFYKDGLKGKILCEASDISTSSDLFGGTICLALSSSSPVKIDCSNLYLKTNNVYMKSGSDTYRGYNGSFTVGSRTFTVKKGLIVVEETSSI